MWANSILILGEQITSGEIIQNFRLENKAPSKPNALLVEVSGKDWYGSPQSYQLLQGFHAHLDFETHTGEMLLTSTTDHLNEVEKLQIARWLIQRSKTAWQHKKSTEIRSLLST